VDPKSDKPRYGYIDCVRGYAVLLVITAHYADHLFPNLPFPVHRLAVMGWYGVQLFFIASSVTLLMSWRHEEQTHGRSDLRAFLIRRIFRIAPAYYAAAIFYFIVFPPAGEFDLTQALAAITFVNSWHPLLMPSIPGRWYVVPGGWSIGVEFTSYMLFPLYVAWTRSLGRAVIALIGAVIAGVLINNWEFTFLSGKYPAGAVVNFMFFWFPNQACVFAFGGIAFYAIARLRPQGSESSFATFCAAAGVVLFFGLTFLPLGHFLGGSPAIPISLAVCVPLTIFVVALSQTQNKLFVNTYIMRMGEVSFSAYLAHFAVLAGLGSLPALRLSDATGYTAIALFAAFWPLVVVVTYAAAWSSYRFIETPGISTGKNLIARLQRAPSTTKLVSPRGP